MIFNIQASSAKSIRVPRDVFANKTGDKEIAMIIPMAEPQCERLSRVRRSLLQQFRAQLFDEKRVGKSLIDKDVVEVSVRQSAAKQGAGIVLFPI